MGLASLSLFVAGMWAMVLVVAAFLVIFVAPIDSTIFDGKGNAASISLVQAAIAIVAVIALVFGLSRMKRIYLRKKLKQ
jgi:hypothetical protein